MDQLRRTPLYGLHRQLGARMTGFAGFDMPLNYSGIIEEHQAVRQRAGVFDLSHMGELAVEGQGAAPLLERVLTNSAGLLQLGQAHYTLMLNEQGGTIDDLIVYRKGSDSYLLCVNAANTDTGYQWLARANREAAELRNESDQTALVAFQGPRAAELLEAHSKPALAALGRFHCAPLVLFGVKCFAARTGYTGEDGFELFLDSNDAPKVFEALLEVGKRYQVLPCGLGARDTLRLEAGLTLYGHELDTETTPLEAALDRFVVFGRGFVGEAALRAEREGGLRKRLLGLLPEDSRSVARTGYRLFLDGRQAGKVTSGTYAPTLGRPVAMGYVSPPFANEGDTLEVEIRGRRISARVTTLPFYRRSRP